MYQKECRSSWEASDLSQISWDPLLVACINASIKKAETAGAFEAFCASMKRMPWSLVHGDFHPANCMLMHSGTAERPFKLVLLDWENVGVGSGPQEIGQFLISHMDPDLRPRVEREIVEDYYQRLISHKPSIAEEMTLEECWQEYIMGGVGKWIWFMPLLASACPPKMTQFFHDQLLAFIRTHGLGPDTIPMPRT